MPPDDSTAYPAYIPLSQFPPLPPLPGSRPFPIQGKENDHLRPDSYPHYHLGHHRHRQPPTPPSHQSSTLNTVIHQEEVKGYPTTKMMSGRNKQNPTPRKTTKIDGTKELAKLAVYSSVYCNYPPLGICRNKQYPGSLQCSSHSCHALLADGSMCLNVCSPVTRVCANGYHQENGRLPLINPRTSSTSSSKQYQYQHHSLTNFHNVQSSPHRYQAQGQPFATPHRRFNNSHTYTLPVSDSKSTPLIYVTENEIGGVVTGGENTRRGRSDMNRQAGDSDHGRGLANGFRNGGTEDRRDNRIENENRMISRKIDQQMISAHRTYDNNNINNGYEVDQNHRSPKSTRFHPALLQYTITNHPQSQNRHSNHRNHHRNHQSQQELQSSMPLPLTQQIKTKASHSEGRRDQASTSSASDSFSQVSHYRSASGYSGPGSGSRSVSGSSEFGSLTDFASTSNGSTTTTSIGNLNTVSHHPNYPDTDESKDRIGSVDRRDRMEAGKREEDSFMRMRSKRQEIDGGQSEEDLKLRVAVAAMGLNMDEDGRRRKK